jgi:Putative peptidoglycan binding domain
MRKTLSCGAMVAMIALAWSADPSPAAQENAPAKKAAVKKKAAAKKGASSRARKTTAKRGVTWRNRQLSPSPDRYREIQGALAAKGFLKPEDATGTWNQTSSDALKKFQAEQNLDSSGKINSLSLIALGLGPRREPAPPAPPKPPPQAPPPGQ